MQGADSIPYTFTCPAGSNGAGFGGGGIALAIGGQVSAGYADAPVGSGYADTVTITVNY
jgi:spore coat protein U-like protein